VPIGQIATTIVAAGLLPTTTPVSGEIDLLARASLELDFPAALAQAAEPQPEAPRIPDATPRTPSFGEKRSWWWHIWAGWAFDIDDGVSDQFIILGVGVDYFIVENFSLTAELNGLYFDQTTQPGFDAAEDGWGIHFALLARWHYLTGDKWSLYLDGGAGIMGTTMRTPGPGSDDARGGSYFNFTPQAGAGFTYELYPDARLMVGCRWFHISNARTSDNNPGSDSLLVYAGVHFPF
jgi:hypothetical protein